MNFSMVSFHMEWGTMILPLYKSKLSLMVRDPLAFQRGASSCSTLSFGAYCVRQHFLAIEQTLSLSCAWWYTSSRVEVEPAGKAGITTVEINASISFCCRTCYSSLSLLPGARERASAMFNSYPGT